MVDEPCTPWRTDRERRSTCRGGRVRATRSPRAQDRSSRRRTTHRARRDRRRHRRRRRGAVDGGLGRGRAGDRKDASPPGGPGDRGCPRVPHRSGGGRRRAAWPVPVGTIDRRSSRGGRGGRRHRLGAGDRCGHPGAGWPRRPSLRRAVLGPTAPSFVRPRDDGGTSAHRRAAAGAADRRHAMVGRRQPPAPPLRDPDRRREPDLPDVLDPPGGGGHSHRGGHAARRHGADARDPEAEARALLGARDVRVPPTGSRRAGPTARRGCCSRSRIPGR
jgi:hypothetical protein